MISKKDFIKEYQINKSLGGNLNSIGSGDQLLMFNNNYRVLSPKEAKYAILQDERGIKLAIPSNRLNLLLNKGIINKVGGSSFFKAKTPTNPASSTGISHRAAPVGATHRDANGHLRVKVSMHPAIWSNVSTGRIHQDHASAEEHHPLVNKSDLATLQKINAVIQNNAHPEDHEKLKVQAMKFFKEKSSHYYLDKALEHINSNHSKYKDVKESELKFAHNLSASKKQNRMDHFNRLTADIQNSANKRRTKQWQTKK